MCRTYEYNTSVRYKSNNFTHSSISFITLKANNLLERVQHFGASVPTQASAMRVVCAHLLGVGPPCLKRRKVQVIEARQKTKTWHRCRRQQEAYFWTVFTAILYRSC